MSGINLREVTNFLIDISFQLGLLFIVMSVILCVVIGFIRLFLYYEEKRNQRLTMLWRPIFAESLYGIPAALPKIRRSEQFSFMILWNHLQESLRGDAKDKLNFLARSVNMNAFALKYLRKKNKAKRLVAIMVIGHLGDRAAWKELRAIAKDAESTILSLAAANALCKIDNRFAAPVIVSLITMRKDWPSYKIASMLLNIGEDYITDPLIEGLYNIPHDEQPRLVRFLKYCSHEKALPIIRKFIAGNPTSEMITACLILLGYFVDSRDIPLIKHYINHPLCYIRVQAIIALGRIAGKDDEFTIIEKLKDEEWWVRYRAAQALSSLPYMDEERLIQIKNSLQDRFARDILIQVMDERGQSYG